MTTDQQKQAIAVRVLAIGKRRAPDRFPAYADRSGNIDRELVLEWAKALGVKTYPPELWEEAVEYWINHLDHGRMATTGEILKAAKHVREQWENDPARRAQFQQLYEAREAEREAKWRAGELAPSRGYPPPRQLTKPPVPDTVLEKIRSVAHRRRVQ